jgi:uncharacterized membrane protein
VPGESEEIPKDGVLNSQWPPFPKLPFLSSWVPNGRPSPKLLSISLTFPPLSARQSLASSAAREKGRADISMPWYYAESGQQKGPVTDEQFQSLVASGAVRGDTLVWRDGMANWAPYSTVAPQAQTIPPGVTPPPAGQVICAECRQVFPQDQTAQFGATFVCGNCKPIYLQKLREGAPTGGTFIGGRRSKPVNADALVEEIRARDYHLDIWSCVTRGWEAVKGNLWPTVGTTLLVMFAMQAAGAIPFLGILIGLVVNGPLLGGLYVYFLKMIRGEPTTVGDGFAGFSKAFVPLMLNMLFMSLLLYIWFAPAAIYAFTSKALTPGGSFPPMLAILAGLALLPMIYLAVGFTFSFPLIVDLELGVMDAIKVSFKVVNMHWWSIFALMLVSGVLAMLGLIACCVGIFITMPIFYAAFCYAYEDIFGVPSSGVVTQ